MFHPVFWSKIYDVLISRNVLFKALASVLWELLLDGFIMSNGNQHAHQGDVLTNPEFSIFVHEVLFVLFLYEVEGWIVYF